MKIVKVIPAAKIPLPQAQILSYFSLADIHPGALVLIKLKKRKTLALVIETQNVREEKMLVRQANFRLKKIEKIINGQEIINKKLRELLLWTSLYYWEPAGGVLRSILPHRSIRKWHSLERPEKTMLQKDITVNNPKKIFYHTLPIKKLVGLCSKVLRNHQQILILYPEILKLEKAAQEMKRHFGDKVLSFSSEMNQKDLWTVWQKVFQGEETVIMATRQGVFLPFVNLGLILVTEEDSLSYKSWDQHPKINALHLALKLAEIHRSDLILTSLSPSMETYWNISQKRYKAATSLFTKIKKSPKIEIVDMKIKDDSEKRDFSYISPSLKQEISQRIRQKKKIVLFQNRRGSATYVFCQDCGYFFQCPHCHSSLVYHSDRKKLVCHWCGHQENPPQFCPQCGGYHLKYSGHGTQKIREELRQSFSKTNIYLLDNDATPTSKDKQQTWEDFYQNQEGSILISTVSLFSLPLEKVDLAAFLNFDLITNFPDFRANEKAVQMIVKMSVFSQKIILQTYNNKNALLKELQKEEYDKVYKDELKLRKELKYPPFWQLVSLRYKNKSEVVAKTRAEDLFKKLSSRNRFPNDIKILGPMPALKPKVKNYYYRTIVLRVKRGKLKQRNNLLSRVPPNWDIDVDPIEF